MSKNGTFLTLFKNNQRDRVFLVRRSDFPIWVLTGGAVETNENPEKAAIREAEEETGFRVKVSRRLGLYEIGDENMGIRKEYIFEGRVLSGTFRPEFPGCEGKWFPLNRLPRDISWVTKQRISDAKTHKSIRPFVKGRKKDTVWNNIHLLILHPLAATKFALKRR